MAELTVSSSESIARSSWAMFLVVLWFEKLASETETLHGDDAVLLLEDVMAQRAFAVPLVVARLLVGLAVEERDEQVFLVVRQADVARVGHRGGHVAVDVAVVVDQHVAQQVGLGVLFADADAHVLDAVEEEPVLEFDDLFLLADVVEDAEHLLVGIGNQIVHHEETADGDDAHYDDERFEYFRQRHARRLHRQQFVVFAQVAQRHDRRQQHRQRQAHGNHVGHGVAHQLDDDAGVEPLAHQLVDIPPDEIHHQDEHHDEEGQEHRSQIRLQYELVNRFHPRRVLALSCRKDNSFATISDAVRTNIMATPEGSSHW